MPLLPLLACAVALAGPATSADLHAALTALADQAALAHPALTARAAQAQALRARAAVAGAWPDPRVGVELSNLPVDRFALDQHPMTGVQLRAEQTLRPRGWSRLQRAVGEGHAAAAQAEVADAAVSLRAEVARTGWALARTRQLAAVTDAHLARAEELLGAARARYETGGVGQHAVLRLTVLRDTLADDRADFDATAAALEAALAEAAGGPAGPLPLPDATAPAPAPPDRDWLALARAHRPALDAAASQGQAADLAADLARIDRRPDLMVWAGYRVRAIDTAMDPGTDQVSVGVGLPLPLGSARRADGAAAAAAAESAAATARAADVEAQVEAAVAAHLARWRRSADKVETYDTVLIPGAAAAVETTRTDFSVGRADFASLFEAEVALLQLERARIQAATDTWLRRAALTAALGADPLEGSP